jgi:hypothetical protein
VGTVHYSVATLEKRWTEDFEEIVPVLEGDYKAWREISCQACFQRMKNMKMDDNRTNIGGGIRCLACKMV